MTSEELVTRLTNVLTDLLENRQPDITTALPDSEIENLEESPLRELCAVIAKFAGAHTEARQFIDGLSKGDLEVEAPKGNPWLSSYKQLQSNLNHLVWQVQRISEGDYNQHIDFLGDFSVYFDKLTSSLKEKLSIENALKASEEKYRLITENISDVIWIIDPAQKRYTYISPSVFSLRGYTPKEVMQKNIYSTLSFGSVKKAEGIFEERLSRFLAYPGEDKVYIDQFQLKCKNGEIIWTEISTKFRYNAQGEPEILGVTRNIEQRKKMEAEILEQNKKLEELNATKDKFFSIIAHDLKNPFNVILGFSELLLDKSITRDEEAVREFAATIQSSSMNAYKLLENLLEWSGAQTGNIAYVPGNFNLVDLLDEVILLLQKSADAKNITIKHELIGVETLFADRNMINTVLRNLISNAIKFTHRNGKINITAKRNHNEIEIRVTDTGIGVSGEDKGKLFSISEKVSRHGTENEAGTGIGLVLCKEFVLQHHGKIWVESEPGKGSDFIFILPLNDTRVSEQDSPVYGSVV